MSHVLALHGIGLGPVGGEASQSSEHAGCRVASCDGNSARCHVRSPDANLHWAGWNRDGYQSWKLLPGLFFHHLLLSPLGAGHLGARRQFDAAPGLLPAGLGGHTSPSAGVNFDCAMCGSLFSLLRPSSSLAMLVASS